MEKVKLGNLNAVLLEFQSEILFLVLILKIVVGMWWKEPCSLVFLWGQI